MIHALLAPALACFGGEGQASFHPANAQVYIEAADVPALVKAYEKAPLVQLLGDPAAAKIADVAKEAGFDLRETLGGMLPVPSEDHPGERFWPWSAATSASFSFVDAPRTTGTEPKTQPKGAGWAVIDFRDAPAAEQAERALLASFAGKDAAPPSTEESVTLGTRKLVVRRAKDASDTAAWFARDGLRVFLGLEAADPAQLSERVAKPETSFLEKRKLVVDDTGFQPACGTTLFRSWSELERMPAVLEGGPIDGEVERSLVETFAPAFLPFIGQKGRYRMQLCGDRFVSESLVERIGSGKELDALYGSGEIPLTTARMIPKEAVGAWALALQPAQFEALLERTLTRMASPLAASPDDKTPKISAAVGDSAVAFLLPIQMNAVTSGGQAPLPLVAAAPLKDAAAFEAALGAWIARVKAADPTLKVDNKPYHKMPMYTFTLGAQETSGNNAQAAASTKPTLTILPDRVLLTTSRKFAQDEVRRFEQPSTEVHVLAGEGAIPKGAFEASTMDWGGAIGKFYDAARGLLPMMLGQREPPVDVESLPTSAQLFRYFRPSASYSTRVGDKVYTRSETSLGPEVPAALGIAAIGMFSSMARELGSLAGPSGKPTGAAETQPIPRVPEDGAEPKPAGPGERDVTLAALRSVRTGLAIYKSQFSRAPDTLDELLKGTEAFPKGFLDGGALPKDGWGRALVYAAREGGAKYDLRSVGANGTDEQGGGDDVSLP